MTPPISLVLRASAVLALAAGAVAPALSAQTVRGAVVDTAGGAPVAGAVVRLVPAAGAPADSAAPGSVALTDAQGRFLLRAPAPGRWVVEAKRIGVRPARTAALDLGAGETREVTLGVSPVTARLSAVRVVGGALCAERVASAQETATLWEEARAALTATRLTRESGPPASLARWTRRVNPRSGAIIGDQQDVSTAPGANRFTAVPAEQLSARGYIVQEQDGSHTYFAPDVTALLSAAFVRDHCFRPAVADSGRDLVGLAFEPAAHRRVSDIAGVLWLDAATHELRRLDYQYTRLPHAVRYDRAGGTVEFERIPGGAWIVRRWVIRMPEVALSLESEPGGAYPGSTPRPRPMIVAILEEGGEARVVAPEATGAAPRDATPVISGTVWDSAAAAPLVGARVSVEGAPYAATTDEAGRYRLLLHGPGTYTVTVRHARVDSLGVARPRAAVTVGAGEARRDLALPSAAAAAAALCPGTPAGAAIVHGRVAFVGVSAPPAAPTLEVRWLERALVQGQYAFRPVAGGGTVAVTGAERRFVLCGAPAGRRVRAVLRAGGATTDLDLHLAPGQIAWRDIVLTPR